jgi:2-polyprenyl-6-methoxyphenol hydroxylase-like FAD-dependent oxidoreductase
LARRGVDFRIVEKAHSYFAGSRGKGLQPRSMEVPEDLQVIDQILECGRFHLPFRAYDGATILGDRDLHEDRHPTPKHPDGWVALCPLPSTEMFQCQAQVPAREEGEPSLETFQRIIDERTGRSDLRLYGPTWLSLYRANVRMAERSRMGRVLLAGDAAHVHSPAGGQGMNTGIQDAYNLGWKLAAVLKGAQAWLLDTHEEERLPVAAALLGITTRLHREVFNTSLKEMRRGPETLQLGLNYRGHSLSQ